MRADEASSPGDEAGVAGGMGGDEFCRDAGSLREAGDDDAVERNTGGEGLVDDRLDAGQGRVEEGLVEFALGEEGVGIPGEAVALRGEEGDGGVGGGQRAGEGEDVTGVAASTVEEDDGAGGLAEGSAGGVELAVGVGVLRGRRGLGSFVPTGPQRRGRSGHPDFRGWGGGCFVEGKGGEALLEVGATRLEPGWKAETFAEGFEGLVDGKAGVVGSELEEDAAGFAEVDGVEVFAVKDFGGG